MEKDLKECFSELIILFDELKKEIITFKTDLLECKQSIEELTVILELINNITLDEQDTEVENQNQIKVDKNLN